MPFGMGVRPFPAENMPQILRKWLNWPNKQWYLFTGSGQSPWRPCCGAGVGCGGPSGPAKSRTSMLRNKGPYNYIVQVRNPLCNHTPPRAIVVWVLRKFYSSVAQVPHRSTYAVTSRTLVSGLTDEIWFSFVSREAHTKICAHFRIVSYLTK